MPAITVLTAVYNTPPALIVEAWRSLLRQTYTDWDWLIVDDASSRPATIEQLERLSANPRVNLLHLRENRGPGGARNAGLEIARTDLIAVLDSDDVALPDWLRRQAAYMAAHPGVDICGCQLELFRHGSREVLGQTHHAPVVTQQIFDHQAHVRGVLWFVNNGGTIFRRRRVAALGGYHPTLRRGEDGDLWIRAFQAGLNIHNLPDVLMRYRRCGP